MDGFEDEMYEDLAYEEAEGAAAFDEDLEIEEFDEFEEDDFLEEDEGLEGMEDYFEDDEFSEFDEADEYEADEYGEFDAFDEFEDDYEDDEVEDMLDSALAYALEAEDADEFFKKVWKGIKRVGRGVVSVARKAAPVIGGIARVAGPVLSAIPHPYAQIAGTAAGLLSSLRAEGATEEEALEAFAELAVRDPRAIPIVAGLTARTVLKRQGARLSYAARKKAVKDAKAAAKVLVAKRGRTAIRALPKIAKSVKRTAAVKRTPVAARSKIVKRTAAKVARSSRMTRNLSRPSAKAKRMVKKTAAAKTRSYTIKGPARITITAA